MKYITFLILFFSITTSMRSQSIYDLSFKNINGDTISMKQFAGKKVLVIVLPQDPKDSIYDQILQFKKRVKDTIDVIGVSSLEEGFTKSRSGPLKTAYSTISITLTEGVNSRKSAGASQSPVLQWLTNSKKNRHFNNDAEAPGAKFFISETGRLYAVFSYRTSLQSRVIDQVINSSDLGRSIK